MFEKDCFGRCPNYAPYKFNGAHFCPVHQARILTTTEHIEIDIPATLEHNNFSASFLGRNVGVSKMTACSWARGSSKPQGDNRYYILKWFFLHNFDVILKNTNEKNRENVRFIETRKDEQQNFTISG